MLFTGSDSECELVMPIVTVSFVSVSDVFVCVDVISMGYPVVSVVICVIVEGSVVVGVAVLSVVAEATVNITQEIMHKKCISGS